MFPELQTQVNTLLAEIDAAWSGENIPQGVHYSADIEASASTHTRNIAAGEVGYIVTLETVQPHPGTAVPTTYTRRYGRGWNVAANTDADWIEGEAYVAPTVAELKAQADGVMEAFVVALRDAQDREVIMRGAYPAAVYSHSLAAFPHPAKPRKPDQTDQWPQLPVLDELPESWRIAIKPSITNGRWVVQYGFRFEGVQHEKQISDVSAQFKDWYVA